MGQKIPITSSGTSKGCDEASAAGVETRGRCPICKERTEQSFRPFCSRRCADVDLSRWLRGGYIIPEAGLDGDEDDEAVVRPQDGPADEHE